MPASCPVGRGVGRPFRQSLRLQLVSEVVSIDHTIIDDRQDPVRRWSVPSASRHSVAGIFCVWHRWRGRGAIGSVVDVFIRIARMATSNALAPWRSASDTVLGGHRKSVSSHDACEKRLHDACQRHHACMCEARCLACCCAKHASEVLDYMSHAQPRCVQPRAMRCQWFAAGCLRCAAYRMCFDVLRAAELRCSSARGALARM